MSGIKNQETDINSTVSINNENSEKVSKVSRKEMMDTEQNNDKAVTKTKPKLIIKIPKPFGLGYWIIDLSKLLSKLIKGLLAAIVAILLAKIAQLLTEFIQKMIDKGISANNISQSNIDGSLNGMNMNNLIDESQSEYDKQQQRNKKLNSSLTVTDPSIDSNKIVDVYGKGNTNKKNISNKNKYTIDKRNRKDILDSEIVNERNGSNNRNIKLVKNPNYGVYLD